MYLFASTSFLIFSLLCCDLAGLQLGTIIGMPLTGYLCSSSFWGGWPSVFYIFGEYIKIM